MHGPSNEDAVSLAELRRDASSLVRAVATEHRPKLITRAGVAVAVLVGLEEYERLRYGATLQSLLDEIREADAEIDSGGGVSHEDLERELGARWGR